MKILKDAATGLLVLLAMVGAVCALGFACRLITIIFKTGWSLI